MKFSDKAARIIATVGFAGHLPVAPGTVGSALGLPICFLLSRVGAPAAVLLVGVLAAVAVWAAHRTEKMMAVKDPGCVVIDEVAGMAVTLLGLPFTLKTALLGFLTFRLLDILKPPPVSTVERCLSGGVGIVMDDLVAGAMANLICRVVFFFSAP